MQYSKFIKRSLDKFINWIFRRKSIKTTLYILIIFLLEQLTILGNEDGIIVFFDELEKKFACDEFMLLMIRMTRFFAESNSPAVIIVTIASILLIAFLFIIDSYKDQKRKLSPYVALTSFGILAIITLGSVFFLTDSLNTKTVKERRIDTSQLVKIEKALLTDSTETRAINDYFEIITETNMDFITYLKMMKDSIQKNPAYKTIAFVDQASVYNKSEVVKKLIKKTLKDTSVCALELENITKLDSSFVAQYTEAPEFVFYSEEKKDSLVLGTTYDYVPKLNELMMSERYKDKKVVIINGLDDQSKNTVNNYLEEIKIATQKNYFKGRNLIVVIGKPEIFSDFFSNPYFKVSDFNVDLIYGIGKNIPMPVINSDERIKELVYNWTYWFGKEKINRAFTEQQNEMLYQNVVKLINKYPFLRSELSTYVNQDVILQAVYLQSITATSTEEEIKQVLFDKMLTRGFITQNHKRLEVDEKNIYEKILKKMAKHVLIKKELINNGWFFVSGKETLPIKHKGKKYIIPVQEVLVKSNLAQMKPNNLNPQFFRFEPFWLHRYLVEKNNK